MYEIPKAINYHPKPMNYNNFWSFSFVLGLNLYK